MNRPSRLVIMAGCILAFARVQSAFANSLSGITPTYVYETAVSSVVTNIVNISSAPSTQADSPQLAGRVAVEIQNIDSSANLWCLTNSTTPTTNNGRKIAAGASWIVSTQETVYYTVYSTSTSPNVNVYTSPARFWCVTDGAAATKAAVTQLY